LHASAGTTAQAFVRAPEEPVAFQRAFDTWADQRDELLCSAPPPAGNHLDMFDDRNMWAMLTADVPLDLGADDGGTTPSAAHQTPEPRKRKPRKRKRKLCTAKLDSGAPCPSGALGATSLCSVHGGGKRCTAKLDSGAPCPSGAQGATSLCSVHGGGMRCTAKLDSGDDCLNGALGATGLCAAHGGGKRCPNCITWPDARLGDTQYDNYCARCFKRVFPKDPRSAHIYEHTKEIMVRNLINAHFEGFIHDHPIWVGGCDCAHKRRVDHRCLVEGTMLAVETDEFAHRSYNKHDEQVRYDDLLMAFTGKWIFIRFNPDNTLGGKGVDIEVKLEALKKQIEKQIERIKAGLNTEFVEIMYMYY
jgi:hypothetical protein